MNIRKQIDRYLMIIIVCNILIIIIKVYEILRDRNLVFDVRDFIP